jgi:hypothetical protein
LTPSLGVLIGLPVASLLVLAGLACLIAGIRLRVKRGLWTTENFDVPAWGVAATGIVVVVATLVVTGFTMWPWTAEYHEWQTVSGTITGVNSRLLASGTEGGGSTQRFVVQFAGDGRQYSCDDTRCALLHKGDQLTLSCKRAWQYTGTPGYDCNYIDSAVKP